MILGEMNLEGELVSVQRYTQTKHADFLSLLEKAYKAGQVDDLNYDRLRSDRCTYQDPDDVYDYFLKLNDDLINCIENHELFILESRIVKGAELIEKETDPVKKQKYMQLYDALIAEHTALKEGRTYEQAEAV